MYMLNIARAIKKMSVNEIRYSIFENYYKGIGFKTTINYLEQRKRENQ